MEAAIPHLIQDFLLVKAGMAVTVTDTDGAWRMADVDTSVINWINIHLTELTRLIT